jgi:hypothetical protein
MDLSLHSRPADCHPQNNIPGEGSHRHLRKSSSVVVVVVVVDVELQGFFSQERNLSKDILNRNHHHHNPLESIGLDCCA